MGAVCSSELYSFFRIVFFGGRSSDEGSWDHLYNIVCVVLQAHYAADTSCSSSGDVFKQAYGATRNGYCEWLPAFSPFLYTHICSVSRA
jgi:hypothetical protein